MPDTDDVLLKQEIIFQDNNPDVYLERFKSNLLKLSGNDSDISNYVAERLSDSEIKTLVSYSSRFIKLVKEHFPKGVSKEALVSFARDFCTNPSNINSVIKKESN